MRFKVTIEEIGEEPYTRQEWKKVADSGNKTDNGAVYEYVYSDAMREVSRSLYEQVVEHLDLSTVIRAVNAL